MTNKDLDNLLSQINKDLDSMNKEIEENNAFYLPKIAKKQSKTNVIKWFLFVSIFLIMIGAYITSKYKDEYVWYFAYIPLMASALIFLILFIIFIISFLKVMKIKKEFKEAQVKTNDLQILIERHSKIARNEILERFGETKDEVIRVIGTSLPDLIEYYEYFKDFVLNHPNEKPEVKKIRNFEFGFEKITIKKHFKDCDVIESLSHELSVKNYDEIIQIIKNGITKGHVKIYGFIYSFALLNFPKNDYERIYKELIDNENEKNRNGINFFSFLNDYETFNKRNYKLYLKNMNKSSFYYQLLNVFYNHKIYNIKDYNKESPINYIINIIQNNEILLNNYEINELLKIVFSYGTNIDIKLSNHLLNSYTNLYGKYKDVLRNDTTLLYYKAMVTTYVYNHKIDFANKYLNEIKSINRDDFFMRTYEILIKYDERSFKSLFNKHNYSDILEFKNLEERINSSKDINLSNELYSFKKKYL